LRPFHLVGGHGNTPVVFSGGVPHHQEAAPTWDHRFELNTPGMIGWPGKCPAKKGSFDGGRFSKAVIFFSVHFHTRSTSKKRITMRQQLHHFLDVHRALGDDHGCGASLPGGGVNALRRAQRTVSPAPEFSRQLAVWLRDWGARRRYEP